MEGVDWHLDPATGCSDSTNERPGRAQPIPAECIPDALTTAAWLWRSPGEPADRPRGERRELGLLSEPLF